MSCELKHSAASQKKMPSNFTNSSNVEFFREISNAEILYRWLDIKLAINRNHRNKPYRWKVLKCSCLVHSVSKYIFTPCSVLYSKPSFGWFHRLHFFNEIVVWTVDCHRFGKLRGWDMIRRVKYMAGPRTCLDVSSRSLKFSKCIFRSLNLSSGVI